MPVLRLQSVSKTFGANRVLEGVDLTIHAGEIHALVGENGSGKSTLVKILAGYHAPDDGFGEISVAQTPVVPQHVGEAEAHGLRFVHQDLALVGQLSTVENLGLGAGYGVRRGRPVRWAARRLQAIEAIRRLGYEFDVDHPVRTLQASERTAVAVARALSDHRSPARALVFDEPTANLPGREVQRLFALIRRVRDSGIGILFISHHLGEVFALAQTVTVLRDGRVVASRPVDGITEESLIELMVGHAVTRSKRLFTEEAGPAKLAASRISGGTLESLDLSVAAGEIVGIAGVTGSGREVVAGLVFGTEPRDGFVSVGEAEVPPGRPDLSVSAGIGLVPAERARKAIIHGLDVSENLTIAGLRDLSAGPILKKRAEREHVKAWMQKLDVRPLRPRLTCKELSGGNAQKLILARWLSLRPQVLLLDEPTQGVDVSAKEDIHQRIEAAAAAGCAVLICSTDNEELTRVCDRIIVLSHGHAMRELWAPCDADEVAAACLQSAVVMAP